MEKKINKFYLVKYILKLIVNIALLPIYTSIFLITLVFISIDSLINSDTFEYFIKNIVDNICDFPLDIVKVFYLPDTDHLYI